jgi:transposase
MAHARRKFIELHAANKSTIAATAIGLIAQLYGIEREVKLLSAQQRLHERRTRAGPIATALHDWLIAQRAKITDATGQGHRLQLNRWATLMRYLDDPALPSATTTMNSKSVPGQQGARTGCSRGR